MGSQGRPTAWDIGVDERMGIIHNVLANNRDLHDKLPGLHSLLGDYLNEKVEMHNQDFHRRLLRVFRDSNADDSYQDLLAQFSDDEQTKITRFVEGEDVKRICSGFELLPSLGVRKHVKTMTKAHAVHISSAGPVHVDGLSLDELEKKDGIFCRFIRAIEAAFGAAPQEDTVLVYKDANFENWGQVVDYVPTYTCIPSSTASIQRIVKYAKEFDMGVRCSGFRHSWAPIFGRNGQILISLLGLSEVTKLPNFTALPLPMSAPTELETIEVVPGTPRVKGNTLIRVGVSTTNERLRRWCIANNKYTLPLNVIMVEMTIGGTNGPICHGAGRDHQTLSDLVREIEYVDCNGALQVVNNPEHLRAAAGCFGLMGVITRITFEFSPMTYALMEPSKMPVVRAIPPPDDIEVPPALQVPGLTPKDRASDLARFEKQCESSFYSEWFWFPFSDNAWVNCWNNTTDGSGVVDYPDSAMIYFQFISQFTMNVLQNAKVLVELINAANLNEAAITLFSRAAMFAMPEKKVKTYLTDALHFQRAIQNIPVLDLEVEIPIPSRRDQDAPDFDVVRRAWWDAILKCYKYSSTTPQRMPLEMRIMGDSGMVMAPQRGNRHGTCAIEVLTLRSAGKLWNPYAQEVLDTWMSYTDENGQKLKTRPHWAKQWEGLKVDGKDWWRKMQEEDYKDEIVEFKSLLAAIGKEHGWTLADLKRRFSNDFFDKFYFNDV